MERQQTTLIVLVVEVRIRWRVVRKWSAWGQQMTPVQLSTAWHVCLKYVKIQKPFHSSAQINQKNR